MVESGVVTWTLVLGVQAAITIDAVSNRPIARNVFISASGTVKLVSLL
jgi:hypothetical protein